MTDPRSRSLQFPAISRKAARRFGALAGVALPAETRMSERGTIVFPLIGEVALAGHTRH
jgi:protein involved in polysaccharide export with SLBB domain